MALLSTSGRFSSADRRAGRSVLKIRKRSLAPSRLLVICLAVTLIACGGAARSGTRPPAGPSSGIATATPSRLTGADVAELAAIFSDKPFIGGQVAPFLMKWMSDSTFVFMQLSGPVSASSTVAYLGLGVKGTFCAQTRPDRTGGSFTRFQRYQAPAWDSGAGGRAGDQGYWLSFLAVDRLVVSGRTVPIGIDYRYPAPAAPSCGADPAGPNFEPAAAGGPGADAIARIFALFNEQPLQGGQVPPRVFKSLHDRVLAFAEFDRNSPTDARELHWFGIFIETTYCRSTQPAPDFVHFHRLVSANYATGHGGPAGSVGFWGIWVSAERFQFQGRDLIPGVDREHNPTSPPSSC